MKRVMLVGYAVLIHLLAGVLLVRFFADWRPSPQLQFETAAWNRIPDSWGADVQVQFSDFDDLVIGRIVDADGHVPVYVARHPSLGTVEIEITPEHWQVGWTFMRSQSGWAVLVTDTLDQNQPITPFCHEELIDGGRMLHDSNGDGIPERMTLHETTEVPPKKSRLIDDPWVPVED